MKAKQLIRKGLEVTNLYPTAKKVKNSIKSGVDKIKYRMSPEFKEFNQRKKMYSKLVKKGGLVFDVGANVGNRTEVLLNLGAKVVAVEPQSNCINILKDKFGSHPNFNLFEGGMSEKEGKTTIFVANVDTISSMSQEWINSVKDSVFKENTWDKTETVKVDTLDNLIKQYGVPDLIKVDVEGFEISVLRGLTQKVNYLSYEFMFPKFHKQALECLEYLEGISDIECNYSWGESMQLAEPTWVPSHQFKDVLSKAATESNFGDIYIRFV